MFARGYIIVVTYILHVGSYLMGEIKTGASSCLAPAPVPGDSS